MYLRNIKIVLKTPKAPKIDTLGDNFLLYFIEQRRIPNENHLNFVKEI